MTGETAKYGNILLKKGVTPVLATALRVNSVHGRATRSRSRGFCQARSGCLARCSAARKVIPQGWPSAASKAMRRSIEASAAFACTVPAAPKGPTQLPMPRGESSTWPHSVRSLGASSRSSWASRWSAMKALASARSTLPACAGISSCQRTRRALALSEGSFRSKVVSSAASFGDTGKLAPTKTPSFVRSSVTFFSPSSSRAISPVLVSATSHALAYPPLLPVRMMRSKSSIEAAYCMALRARTNSGIPAVSKPLKPVIVVSVIAIPAEETPKSSPLWIRPGKPSIRMRWPLVGRRSKITFQRAPSR